MTQVRQTKMVPKVKSPTEDVGRERVRHDRKRQLRGTSFADGEAQLSPPGQGGPERAAPRRGGGRARNDQAPRVAAPVPEAQAPQVAPVPDAQAPQVAPVPDAQAPQVAAQVPDAQAPQVAPQVHDAQAPQVAQPADDNAAAVVQPAANTLPARHRGRLGAEQETSLDALLGSMSPAHYAQVVKKLDEQTPDTLQTALEGVLRGETAWRLLERGDDEVFQKLMMYLVNSANNKASASYDRKGKAKTIHHPDPDAGMGLGRIDPDWVATRSWDKEPMRDESRSQQLYGTTSQQLRSGGPAPVGTGHDEALSYVQGRAQKGALRAELGANSLQGAHRFLAGTKGTLDELVSLLERQDTSLIELGGEKRAHKRDGKQTKKLKAWRWQNLADISGEASANELLQAALMRLKARREVLATEVGLIEEAIAGRKTRDSVPEADRDTARRAGRALGNLPKEHHKLEKFDRHEVGSESVSATVGASAGVGINDHLSAGGGLSVGVSHGRNVGDDRRFRQQTEFAVGLHAGLGHAAGGGGGSAPVDVASTGVSASVSHTRGKTYKDTVHKAAREATSSILPGETQKNRDALQTAQTWMTQGGPAPLGGHQTPPIMPELNEALDLVGEVARLRPERVSSNTVSGTVSVGDAMVGAEASASVSHTESTFTRGRERDGDKQERKGSTTTGSFAVSVGGFTVSATLVQMANDSNWDNDGVVMALDFSASRAFALPIGDPGALIETVGASIGQVLSDSPLGERADGRPAGGLQQWLTPAKMALEAGINLGLAQAVGALPEMAMAASPVSVNFSKGKSFTLNFVRSNDAWALQYSRLSNSVSAGVSGSGQAGPAPVTVDAGVGYDKSMMQGERLGDNTLTYAQLVYNGYKNQNTEKSDRGDHKWAKFSAAHGDEMTRMRANIAQTAPKSKMRKELEAAHADLLQKQQYLAANPGGLRAALGASGPKLDPVDAQVADTLAALGAVLQGTPPSQQQVDDYMEKFRVMTLAIRNLSPDVNRVQKATPNPLLEEFATTFFGGLGAKHGWVDG